MIPATWDLGLFKYVNASQVRKELKLGEYYEYLNAGEPQNYVIPGEWKSRKRIVLIGDQLGEFMMDYAISFVLTTFLECPGDKEFDVRVQLFFKYNCICALTWCVLSRSRQRASYS